MNDKQNIFIFAHYQYLSSYYNKNIGYMFDVLQERNYDVKVLCCEADLDSNYKNYDTLIVCKYLNIWNILLHCIIKNSSMKNNVVLYVYPNIRFFDLIIPILYFFNVSIIIKTDSLNIEPLLSNTTKYRAFRTKIMRHFYSRFTSCIIVENHILRNFFSSGNVRLLNYGFPERNKRIIESIKKNNTTKVFEITYSGRIVAQKGLDRLILAVKELTEGAFMTEVRINVLGKFYDIEYEKKIDLMIKKYDLIDKIKFEGELGPKEYYQRLLNTNCIFVPSINEGHCNVVQDAIACQTVVGVTTGVKTGNTFKNKRLIAQNDIEGIKNALLYIYNNYEKLSQNYGDVYDIKTVKSIDHFYHAIFEAIEGKYA